MTERAFSDRLRFLRNERKISARKMSLVLGQNESYINKIETGQRSISMEINNTSIETETLLQTFRKLKPNQAEHIYTLLCDLTKK